MAGFWEFKFLGSSNLWEQKDSELSKDPEAQPIYDEMFRLLENGASYSEVADWLNDTKVKMPPHARSKSGHAVWSRN